jgi:hypothetical protein
VRLLAADPGSGVLIMASSGGPVELFVKVEAYTGAESAIQNATPVPAELTDHPAAWRRRTGTPVRGSGGGGEARPGESGGPRLPRIHFFRSGPRRQAQPVASAAVDGFTVPVADLCIAAPQRRATPAPTAAALTENP